MDTEHSAESYGPSAWCELQKEPPMKGLLMSADIFDSSVRSDGDLAGVFEYDGQTGYFYLYEVGGNAYNKVVGAYAVDVPESVPITTVDAALAHLDPDSVAVAFPSMRHPE
jgi:hypothetical protein